MRRRSDAQLERTFGTDRGMRLIFKGAERAFVPEKAGKFSGDVQYELTGPNGGRDWVVRIADGRAVASPGRSEHPAVTFKMSVPLLIRIAAQEVHPAKAMMEGDLELKGDFELAARLGEMFGQDALI